MVLREEEEAVVRMVVGIRMEEEFTEAVGYGTLQLVEGLAGYFGVLVEDFRRQTHSIIENVTAFRLHERRTSMFGRRRQSLPFERATVALVPTNVRKEGA